MDFCKLTGHKKGVVHMRTTHMHYLVPLAYLRYTYASGSRGQMREGCVSLASDSWRIWGIEISFRLEIGSSFHVWGLSCDEGTSCWGGFLILSPLGFTADTHALGLHGLVPKLSPSTAFFSLPQPPFSNVALFVFHTPNPRHPFHSTPLLFLCARDQR